MFTKKLLPAAVTTALLAGAGLAQADGISANVTLATDYTFRGVSQTDEKGAIQGGFDYAHDTGFYVGIWASNVNFDEANNDNTYHPYGGSNASTEMDYYGGFAGETESGFGYDISYIYFDYAGDSGFDYQEYALKFSYSMFDVGVNYSDEYLGNGGPKFWYPYVDASFDLGSGFTLSGHVGYSDMDEDGLFEEDEDSYTDWSVTLGTTWQGVDLALAYVDTDIDGLDAADARAVFSVSKSF